MNNQNIDPAMNNFQSIWTLLSIILLENLTAAYQMLKNDLGT